MTEELNKKQEEMLRVYKIMYLLEAAQQEMEFLDQKHIKYNIFDRFHSVFKKINHLKIEIKKEAKGDFEKMFDGFSNDKIFAMLSVLQKMIFLDEASCQQVENAIVLNVIKEEK
jgi:uncharacterized protein (UPF0305 family)